MTPLHVKRAGAPLRAGTHTPAPVLDTGGGFFAGYASVFGQPDDQGDVVEAGAFARALARREPSRIALLYQHDVARPVGQWMSLRDDGHGLWVEGQLTLDAEDGRNAYALLKSGALTGLSIGFRTVKAQRRPGGGRSLRELDLWEVSLVTFPMLNTARVEQVKSEGGQAQKHGGSSGGLFSSQQSQMLARVMRRAGAAMQP